MLKSAAMSGRVGRYMSVHKGPKAVSQDRRRVVQAKRRPCCSCMGVVEKGMVSYVISS